KPSSTEAVAGLQRTLHTLKGGARLVGATPIGDLSHALESLLEPLSHGLATPTDDDVTLAQEVADRLSEQVESLSKGPRVRNADELVARLEQLHQSRRSTTPESSNVADEIEAEAETEAEVAEAEAEAVDAEAVEAEIEEAEQEEAEQEEFGVEEAEATLTEEEAAGFAAAHREAAIEARAVQPPTSSRREQIRVQSELLDRLVNNAGEVSIYRSRLEQQNAGLGFNLSELEQTVDRLRNQLRQLEIETEAQILFRYEREQESGNVAEKAFDPLELDRFSTMQQVSRSLLETVNDLTSINDFLDEQQGETETLLLQQSRLTTDLQDGLMRTRMVPFSQIVPRLRRLVRQTSGQVKKQVELTTLGVEGEIDRTILDRMLAPLEHILRNAVSHGIELPEQRSQLGKGESGVVALELSREGNDVLITVSDDGGGMRVDAIRQKAIERGMLDADAEVQDSDILQFVLEHGFSTADEVTQIAGRGVGLDVVVSEIKQLGGSLDMQSTEGKGTSFTVRLPLTLAISDALLVELSDEVFAIPHTSIEGVVRVSRDELQGYYDDSSAKYNYAGQEYHVNYLGSLLHERQPSLADLRKWYPLLLVRAGEHRVALQVDNLLGNRQIVVKPVGPQIGSVLWISGGTILGDGRVALILDVTALVRTGLAHVVPEMAEVVQPVVEDRDSGVSRTIMVVDDSITVRKVTGRLLERHGMNVITAKDGVDALAVLQDHRPDMMLLDIEMPRMDGFELARHMRNSEQLGNIPIIMITSRTGDKHRTHALELGVKRYLGKPYQEKDLMDNILSVLAGDE
ncbi:MAG: response regulator, partial [Candidatus Sedimenticola sp. (ex Thyasira tokunagai)]